MRVIPFVCMMFLLAVSLPADAKKDKKKCEEAKAKIRVIEAKMRQGYTASQGIRYEEKLRELRDERYRFCR